MVRLKVLHFKPYTLLVYLRYFRSELDKMLKISTLLFIFSIYITTGLCYYFPFTIIVFSETFCMEISQDPHTLDLYDKEQSYDTDTYKVYLESSIIPRTTYEINVGKMTSEVIHKKEICNYDSTLYATEVRTIPIDSADMPNIHFKEATPDELRIHLLYRKDQYTHGKPMPLFLNGYGAYGLDRAPKFEPDYFPLVDRGIIYARVEPRGEVGGAFARNGKLDMKCASVKDYLSAKNYLIAQNLTRPDILCLEGISAGAMLAGTAVNMESGIAKACVLNKPFLDVLDTMMDPTLPFTQGEYGVRRKKQKKKKWAYCLLIFPSSSIQGQNAVSSADHLFLSVLTLFIHLLNKRTNTILMANFQNQEWGNPAEDIKVYERLRSLSFPNNLQSPGTNHTYPNMLFLTSLYDISAPYWGALKSVAEMRHMQIGGPGQILLVSLYYKKTYSDHFIRILSKVTATI